MSSSPWIWSQPHSNCYYVTYDVDGKPVYTWAEQQATAQAKPEIPHRVPSNFLDDGKIDEYELSGQVPYVYVEKLGHGGNGVVEKVQHRTTEEMFARKSMVVSKKKQAGQESTFRNEIAVIRRLCTHQRIVQVVAAYRAP